MARRGSQEFRRTGKKPSARIEILAPNFVIQEMSLGIHYNTREHDLLTYLTNPEVFRVQEGMVEALEGDGLGVEIDEARVREAAPDGSCVAQSGFARA